MSAVERLLSRLTGVLGRGPRWRAICPAHESRRRTRSLSILEADDGHVLLHCHAGCSVPQVARAAGVDLADLFPPRGDDQNRGRRIRKPWPVRHVVDALRVESMVAWVILNDVADGKILSQADRQRARQAARSVAKLIAELERAT